MRFVILFAAAVLMVGVIVASTGAQAEDCNSPRLNTYQHANCEDRNLSAATTKMEVGLAKALAAAKATKAEGWVYEYEPKIWDTQLAWSNWMKKECELESATVMGSAGAFVEPMCKQRLTVARTKELNEITRQLEPPK